MILIVIMILIECKLKFNRREKQIKRLLNQGKRI